MLDVGLVVADDLVSDAVAQIAVLELDRRAEHDAAAGIEHRRIDDLRIGELGFDERDSTFDKALPFLGGVVVGIFGDVAV